LRQRVRISELRRRISEAKKPVVHVAVQGAATPAPSAATLANEIQQLARSRDAGVLTDEEFVAAKQRLLA
jgi:hypothetical protein